jgi:hypothetical protein
MQAGTVMAPYGIFVAKLNAFSTLLTVKNSHENSPPASIQE